MIDGDKNKNLNTLLEATSLSADGTFADDQAAQNLLGFMVNHRTGSSFKAEYCESNEEFVQKLRDGLDALGVQTWYRADTEHAGKKQASLVARIGPEADGGIVLSAHTDVVAVPDVEKASWSTKDPFLLQEMPDGLTARGAVDMKQAIVNFMAIAQAYKDKQHLLKKPVYIALSWGEEIGCIGAQEVCDMLKEIKATPELVVVGEPTDEKLVVGHKGASLVQIDILGAGGHSGSPANYLSASRWAAKLQLKCDELQERYMDESLHDTAFKPPYACVNIGVTQSGAGANAVPSDSSQTLCLRSTSKVSMEQMHADLNTLVKELNVEMQAEAAAKKADLAQRGEKENPNLDKVGIGKKKEQMVGSEKVITIEPEINVLSDAPPLPLQKGAVLERVKNARGMDFECATEPYCTDGGVFSKKFPDATTVVCGTGNIWTDGAHKPNEHISPKDLRRGPIFPLQMIAEFCLDRQQTNFPDADWMIPQATHSSTRRSHLGG